MKPGRTAMIGLLVLAFGLGFVKVSHRPAAAEFRVAASSGARAEAARFDSRFASSRLHAQAHAASLIELKDGRIRAFWFSGSREGAPDVEIHSAVFDPAVGQWGAERTIIDRDTTERGVLRYVGKLGNPVAGRAADGTLRLYYVTVSFGGWGGSSITAINSVDEGETWSVPQRLITSPFLNISTLVRNGPFLYSDGTMGLPVYHEFISKFGELLRFDRTGRVFDKQRLAPGGSGTLQPVVLVRDARNAQALMRYGGAPPRRVVGVATQDAGQHWSAPERTGLPNPDSALSAIMLADGRILAALNNIEQGRDALSLMLSADGGASWKLVYSLEDQRGQKLDEAHYLETASALLRATDSKAAAAPPAELNEYLASVRQQGCTPQGCRYEFSYPFLLQARNGEFHLAYTWNRTFIKHVRFNQAWLDQQAEKTR